MTTTAKALGAAVWDLPPLILHPFNERIPPAALLENSKAALMMAGMIPDDGSDWDDLTRRLLKGRHAEVRMLYFLGKDVHRWLGQCRECASRIPELEGAEIREQSFSGLLTGCPPASVREKLIRWGVADYSTVFSRAVGLNAVFSQPPSLESLAEEFLRNYHRYADAMYRCFMESQPHRVIQAANFRFELYASGEYSRMLESAWGAEGSE
ncbi:MAG TPA: hypothetical protein VMU19_09315 [Bryobacteraceae bacterium]|nr:hypothetical protein [Bryobacteraceae bacterium]